MDVYLKRMHPISALVYFLSVIIITMFGAEPVLMLISLFFGICLNILSAGVRKTVKLLLVMLPFMLAVTLTNPLISHYGKTVLYLVLGNAYTLEALIYGAVLSVTLAAVVLHFAALGRIVNVEKILALFGRAMPNLALLISVTVKNITSVTRRLSEATDAQKGLGYYAEKKGLKALVRRIKTFGTVISVSLEDAVDTAIAMKGKCYGVKRRSSVGIGRMTLNDVAVTVCSAVLFGAVLFAMSKGAATFEYYPTVMPITLDIYRTIMYGSFALCCVMPIIFSWKEALKWKYLISRI